MNSKSIRPSIGLTILVGLFLISLFLIYPNHQAFRDKVDEQIKNAKKVLRLIRSQLHIPECRPLTLFRILETERIKLEQLQELTGEIKPTKWQRWRLQNLLKQCNGLEEELKIIVG